MYTIVYIDLLDMMLRKTDGPGLGSLIISLRLIQQGIHMNTRWTKNVIWGPSCQQLSPVWRLQTHTNSGQATLKDPESLPEPFPESFLGRLRPSILNMSHSPIWILDRAWVPNRNLLILKSHFTFSTG